MNLSRPFNKSTPKKQIPPKYFGPHSPLLFPPLLHLFSASARPRLALRAATAYIVGAAQLAARGPSPLLFARALGPPVDAQIRRAATTPGSPTSATCVVAASRGPRSHCAPVSLSPAFKSARVQIRRLCSDPVVPNFAARLAALITDLLHPLLHPRAVAFRARHPRDIAIVVEPRVPPSRRGGPKFAAIHNPSSSSPPSPPPQRARDRCCRNSPRPLVVGHVLIAHT
ncbi:uncharacterized protein A4U43_C07F39270 [Asparagus officinalis]|uniref:Uncharacterized protein n=1 Tax=Asparagus officinalis TaxID=4686 RepID=A0A5P1ENP1_ASPOF|nr:uncharacterized protein A4U43_C07F39270 [Asparagus officinalis]